MSKGTKITKSLNSSQMEFLRMLDSEEIEIFTAESINKIIRYEPEKLKEVLENLVRKQFLSRIERGKYCRSNFRDEYVIGSFVAQNSAIAYWTALNIHGLTEQFPNTIFVQTTQRKYPKNIFGASYQFVHIVPEKQIGIAYNGYGNYRYPITDTEKTIIDCFDQIQYSGGFAELIRAFRLAKLNPDKLIEYTKKINNIAVIKRMGFLSELLNKRELIKFIHYAKSRVNADYSLFDSQGLDKGNFNSDWKLRMNLPAEAIENLAQKQY
jgi:predicted transcriptional regulator of viral defense system